MTAHLFLQNQLPRLGCRNGQVGLKSFTEALGYCSKHITGSCNQEVTDEMTPAMKGRGKTITRRSEILRFCQKLVLVDDGGNGHLTRGASFDSNHAAFAAYADA